MIKEGVETCSSNIVFEFCPWSYPEEKELSMAFLEELEIQMSQNSFINLKYINRYIGRLFENNGSFWGVLTKAFQSSQNLEKIKENVGRLIESSNKRIVVFIDDIDRLRCNEVYEVLTILRNIGNLPNVIFVLAYDKDYLLKIMNVNIDDPQEYLSKFFQVEYALSKIPTNKIKKSLYSKMLDFFETDIFGKYNLRLKKCEDKYPHNAEDDLYDVIYNNVTGVDILTSERDVIKLMNGIRITYPLVCTDVIFADFLELEILRLKYGNVYTKIKYFDPKFLNAKENIISLVFHAAKDFPKVDLLTDYGKEQTFKVLQNLFGNKSATGETMDFSVQRVLGYELYFMNDLAGNIALSKIVDLRSDENYEDLRQLIANYYDDSEKQEDIIVYLKNLKRFISKRDFLNMFRVMLQYPETSGNDSIIKTQVAIALKEYKKENIEEELKDILIKEPLGEGLYHFLDKVQKDYSGINRDTPIIQESVYDEILKKKIEVFFQGNKINKEDLFQLAALATKTNEKGVYENMIEGCAQYFERYLDKNPHLMLKWFFYVEKGFASESEQVLIISSWFKRFYSGWEIFEKKLLSLNEKIVGKENKDKACEIFNRFKDNEFQKISISIGEVDELRKIHLR
ncbi:MAG: hypothetical protein JXR50_09095 [Prolixibacteraceae bacterium]|nr:hypothetical protein [Prolixibacteraceae bacterium]MBN2649882.1 hypothetical protein [Prolixibacteraceae bacterium]